MQIVDFDTEVLRYGYNSMTTPASIIDFNMEPKNKNSKRTAGFRRRFDKENYTEERYGQLQTMVQKSLMSMVYKKGLK